MLKNWTRFDNMSSFFEIMDMLLVYVQFLGIISMTSDFLDRLLGKLVEIDSVEIIPPGKALSRL